MAARLVASVERGFPGDRDKQLRQLSLRAQQMPMGFTKVFLLAMLTITERALSEDDKRLDKAGLN